MRQDLLLFNFKIDKETKDKFINKYNRLASKKLRDFIKDDLGIGGNKIQRDDVDGLIKIIDGVGEKPLQIVGNVEIGKTEMMKKLINNNNNFFVVLDQHEEYGFIKIVDNIPTKLTSSIRILGDKNIENSYYKFREFGNKIMSRVWDKNIIFVIEEAYRYKEMPTWFSFDVKNLLAESRKFGKLIVISQDKLVDFVPCVEVIK